MPRYIVVAKVPHIPYSVGELFVRFIAARAIDVATVGKNVDSGTGRTPDGAMLGAILGAIHEAPVVVLLFVDVEVFFVGEEMA
jgi:hypothetical protein